ncbi:MAG: autotransporter-associated beta strand repeat-containing protein, partial [Puniceicoccales bacterium]|nr:autotransporter-associated beta strand repeat-containing protein [Puniceicoccales bacterium]
MKPELISDTAAAATAAAATNTNTTHRVAQTILSVEETSPEATATHAPQTGLPVLHCADTAPANILRFRRRGAFSRFLAKAAMLGAAVTAASVTPFDPDPADSPATARSLLGSFLAPTAQAADYSETGARPLNPGDYGTYENFTIATGGCLYYNGNVVQNLNAQYTWISGGGSDGNGALRIGDNNSAEVHINSKVVTIVARRAAVADDRTTFGGFENGATNGRGSTIWIHGVLRSAPTKNSYDTEMSFGQESGGSEANRRHIFILGSGEDFKGNVLFTNALNYFSFEIGDGTAAGNGSLAGGWDSATNNYALFSFGTNATNNLIFNRAAGSGTDVTALLDDNNNYLIHDNGTEDTTQKTYAKDNGDISLGYNINGAGSVIQRGTGSTTLVGTNTYTGATTVEAGKLILTGTNTGTSSVTVSPGATLVLDYANRDSHATAGTAILANKPLTLSGDGTDTPSLSILGGDSQGTLANAFSNLTLGADAVVSLVAGTGTTIALDLTALTLNGHTLAFEPDGDGTVTIKTNLPSSVYPDILFNGSPALVDSSGYLQAAADAPDVPVRGGVLSLANEIFTTHITDTGSGAATITIDDTGVTPAGGPLKVRALIMDSGTPGTINLSGKSLSLGTLELAAGTQLTLTDSTTAPTAPLGSQLALTTKVQLGENSTLTLARPTTVAAALAGTGTLALAASGEFTYNGNGTTFAGTVQIGAAGTTATTLTIPGAGFGTSATLAFGGTASVLQYTGAGSRTLGNVTGSGTVKATTGTALTVAANVPTLNFAVDSASSIRLGATVQIGDLTLAGGTYIPTSISTGGTGIALAGDVNLSGDVKFDIVALRDAGLLTIGGTYYFLDYTNLTAAPGTAYLFPGLPINSILFRDDGDKLGFYVQSLSFYRRTWTFGGDGGWSTGSFSNWSNVELPASATGDYFIFNGTGRTLTIGDDEVVRLLNGVTYTVSQLGDYDDMPTNADYGGLYKIDSNKWRITGGTIDTGTAETDKWAVMVRVTDGGLILDSKIIGSGNIAVKHRGNEQVGLIITGDASEYSGTIYCAPNRRGAALSGFGILGENADIVLDGKSWGASFFTINATTTFGAAVSMINTTTNSRLHIGVGNLHGYNDTNGTNFADWNTFAGVVTFTGNNNITVPVLVNRGILAVSKTENLGTSTVTLGNTGGIPGLQFIADGSTITKNVLIENASSIVKVGTADPLNDALDAITATYAGVFSGGGAITKTGKGTLILSNTNTYTGVTNVNAGILKVTGRLNNGTYSNTITIAAGAALEMANADAQTFSGGIAGAGKLIKSGGAGAVTLTTVKTYTGGTLISGGEIIGQLAFNGTNGVFGSFAAGNDILIQNGGILTINAADVFGNSGIATVTNQIITVEDGGLLRTGNTGGHFLGNIVLKGGNIELGAHDATWSFALMRTLAVTGGTAETPVESEIKMREGAAARLLKFGVASVPITVDAYSTLRVLVGTANGNNVATSAFVKKGGGILELTQAGTQTGVTIVEAGAIRFTDASVLGAATSVTLGDAASSTASGYLMFGAAGMNLSGKTLSLVTLAGGTGGGGIDTNGFDGTVSSVISGLGGFYKSGGGTLTLTNTSNSFSGAVNVIGVANVNEGVTTYNGVLASSDLSASGSNSALGAVSASIARDARKLKLENGGTFRFLGTQGSLSGADAPAAVRLPLAVTTGTTGFLDVPTADEVLAVGYINGSNIIKTGLGALYIGGGSGADDGVETGIAGGKLTVADGAVV